jgi:hypothetical protein
MKSVTKSGVGEQVSDNVEASKVTVATRNDASNGPARRTKHEFIV